MPNPNNDPPLVVKGLTKRFRQGVVTIEALNDVSLTVERGQFVAVMGASGSGKSTLLHLMGGLATPDVGTVRVEGTDLFNLSDGALTRFRRRRIGLIFQAYNLIPALSAEQNVLLPLLVESASAGRDGRVDAVLDLLDLTKRRHHRPDQLSGGEQQRVAIGRALITEPALILADEPTGNLDSVSGQSLCRVLRKLCDEQGRTVVMVTHEPAVAVWAERVVVLKDGRNVAELQKSEIRDAHHLAAAYQDLVHAELVKAEPAKEATP